MGKRFSEEEQKTIRDMRAAGVPRQAHRQAPWMTERLAGSVHRRRWRPGRPTGGTSERSPVVAPSENSRWPEVGAEQSSAGDDTRIEEGIRWGSRC